MISPETWAIVAATGLGPVIAVGITLWRDAMREKRGRRLHVFRTLMATRRLAISPEHVSAINLIEVDFYQCEDVEQAWQAYKTHLNTGPEDDTWRERKENLLAKLLFEIGKVLGFDIPESDIYKGGYAPQAWMNKDMRQTAVLEYVNQLAQGKNAVPISPYTPVAENPAAQHQPSDGAAKKAVR